MEAQAEAEAEAEVEAQKQKQKQKQKQQQPPNLTLTFSGKRPASAPTQPPAKRPKDSAPAEPPPLTLATSVLRWTHAVVAEGSPES